MMHLVLRAFALFVLSDRLVVADHAESATAVDRAARVLIQDNYATIMSRLEQQQQELAALKTQDANKQTAIDQLKAEVATLKAEHATQPGRVAFKAQLAKTFTPGNNQLIVFDQVRFNVGNAYHHGTFIAPVNGTYLFSVMICALHGHYVVVDLKRNGNTMIGQAIAGDPTFNSCSSETTVTELAAGDDVIVQHQNTNGNSIYGDGSVHNSFTGVLLY